MEQTSQRHTIWQGKQIEVENLCGSFFVRTSHTHRVLGSRLYRGPNRGTPPAIRNGPMSEADAVKLAQEWDTYLTMDLKDRKQRKGQYRLRQEEEYAKQMGIKKTRGITDGGID